MKLSRVQKMVTNSPLRALVQHRLEASRLEKVGGRLDGGVALEIGCGRGEGARIILDRFGAEHVVGIDIDPAQIDRAQRRCLPRHADRAEFKVGDAVRLDFPDASFDAVFDFQMLHHIFAWTQVLSEVHRVLRPGGRFYFSELLNVVLDNPVARNIFHPPKGAWFNEAELLSECKAAGLEAANPPSRCGKAWLFGCVTKAALQDD